MAKEAKQMEEAMLSSSLVKALVLQAAMTAPGPHPARGILDSLAWVDDATKRKYLENT